MMLLMSLPAHSPGDRLALPVQHPRIPVRAQPGQGPEVADDNLDRVERLRPDQGQARPVKTHTRREGLDRQQFQAAWLKELAGFVAGQADTQRSVRRDVRLHAIDPAGEGKSAHPAICAIDGVTLMAFASMMDLEGFLASDGAGSMAEAKSALADAAPGECWQASSTPS